MVAFILIFAKKELEVRRTQLSILAHCSLLKYFSYVIVYEGLKWLSFCKNGPYAVVHYLIHPCVGFSSITCFGGLSA